MGKEKAVCSIAGCGGVVHGRGLCDFHCTRLRKHGDPLAGGPRRLSPGSLSVCAVDGCGNGSIASHLCAKHYAKNKKYGTPLGGGVQDGRSKEWHVRKGGYVIKFDRANPNAHPVSGVTFQHRDVMAAFIGRPLRSDENVHHKNGDRTDNRIENLELWIKSQPAGQRVQDKVAWARNILHEYGDLIDKLY